MDMYRKYSKIVKTVRGAVHKNYRDNINKSNGRQEFKCCACRSRAKTLLQTASF